MKDCIHRLDPIILKYIFLTEKGMKRKVFVKTAVASKGCKSKNSLNHRYDMIPEIMEINFQEHFEKKLRGL